MSNITTIYHVKFVNNSCTDNDFHETNFTATSPKDVNNIVSGMAAFFSGDDCQCFINGEEAILDRDFGLMNPKEIKQNDQ